MDFVSKKLKNNANKNSKSNKRPEKKITINSNFRPNFETGFKALDYFVVPYTICQTRFNQIQWVY